MVVIHAPDEIAKFSVIGHRKFLTSQQAFIPLHRRRIEAVGIDRRRYPALADPVSEVWVPVPVLMLGAALPNAKKEEG